MYMYMYADTMTNTSPRKDCWKTYQFMILISKVRVCVVSSLGHGDKAKYKPTYRLKCLQIASKTLNNPGLLLRDKIYDLKWDKDGTCTCMW